MKKIFKVIAALLALGTLTACGNLKDSDLTNNAKTSTNEHKGYQTTSTSKNGYRVLLKDGRYLVSPAAGITANSMDNSVDARALEAGLVNLSQNEFATGSYVMQEGQQIKAHTAIMWLGRYSKSNRAGLNPKRAKKGNKPVILDQILEEDFLTKAGAGYQIGGISLGLALNSVDYYDNVKVGAEYHTNISRDQQTAFGKKVANELIKRLRSQKRLKNVPILIGLFSKTGKDSLVGGNYFAYGTANANSSKIDQWKSLNYQSQILPTVGGVKPINATDAAAFTDFKAAIQNYFPNIAGVTATVLYDGTSLRQMNIRVVTQFYGYTQIESFSRLVLSAAKKYLPSNAPVEIVVGSVNQVQALFSKNSADDSYYVHVFGGEQ